MDMSHSEMEAFQEMRRLVLTMHQEFDRLEESQRYTDGGGDEQFDDSMDGDHDSAMASAGMGTDEDYGHFSSDPDAYW